MKALKSLPLPKKCVFLKVRFLQIKLGAIGISPFVEIIEHAMVAVKAYIEIQNRTVIFIVYKSTIRLLGFPFPILLIGCPLWNFNSHDPCSLIGSTFAPPLP